MTTHNDPQEPPDGLPGPAARPAAPDLGRPPRPQLRRPAAADQRRRPVARPGDAVRAAGPARYRARAFGDATQEKLDKLKNGCTVEGVRYGPIEARLDKAKEKACSGKNVWVTLSLTEGKNREVRRVLESIWA
jgi:23S rRNA pseudouridine2605 synthase